MMALLRKQDGFVFLPVIGAFFIILLSLIPFVERQLIWKDDFMKMKMETEMDYLLESGVAFALDQLKQNPNFQGNMSFVYNGQTYVVQFNQDLYQSIVHCTISIPDLTYKRIYVDISKTNYTIIDWKEGFQYD
ncbi:hypothetical protein [Tepidibacillus sp. LV47]|uniref:hypothetical protein n=1 Tax=Tepidibacillus sp. LV47 TaxID=3398228 RepID=UPI003AAB582D